MNVIRKSKGKNAKTVLVQTLLTVEQGKWLETVAEREGLSTGAVLRRMVIQAMQPLSAKLAR